MFRKILTICAILGVTSALGACAGVGPYNGLDTSPKGAVAKIGCFDYNDQLTPEKAAVCEAQAVKCQLQQNRMASGLGETVLANGAASAVVGGAQENTYASMFGGTAKVVSKYTGVGAAMGAIGSANQSAIIYSQAQDSAVGGCSRDFLNRYKALHKGESTDDLFIEPELVRSNIHGNVTASNPPSH